MLNTTSMSPYRNWVWYIVVFVAGLLAVYLVIHFLGGPREFSIRTAGGLFQFFGIGSVALGISQLRRDFGLKGTVAEIIADLLHLAKTAVQRVAQVLGRRSPAINVATAEAVFASDRPRAKVRSDPNASVDERIAQIERRIDTLEDELSTMQDTIDRDREQFNKALGAEEHARENEFEALEDRVTSLAVGGLRLQTVGLLWIFLGVVG
jgi:hypothetical protein